MNTYIYIYIYRLWARLTDASGSVSEGVDPCNDQDLYIYIYT